MHNACRDSIINQKSHRENYRTSKKWWSVHCSEARKRNKFWFSIWRECGRSRSGQVYHNENEFLKSARTTIETKYELIKDKVCEELKPSSANIRRLIGKLKPGCSAGQDGIEAEHLKYALDTDIILHLTNLVTVCFKFGVIPKSCYCGVLVPLIKKSTADPGLAKSYRPIIVSNTFSKLLELCMLEQCDPHYCHDMQFGFIRGRGTTMAASLVEDVVNHCGISSFYV